MWSTTRDHHHHLLRYNPMRVSAFFNFSRDTSLSCAALRQLLMTIFFASRAIPSFHRSFGLLSLFLPPDSPLRVRLRMLLFLYLTIWPVHFNFFTFMIVTFFASFALVFLYKLSRLLCLLRHNPSSHSSLDCSFLSNPRRSSSSVLLMAYVSDAYVSTGNTNVL